MIPVSEKKYKIIKSKFVVDLHQAKKAGRHFDLRIKYNGVLKSFATKKLDLLVSGQIDKIELFPTPDHEMWWMTWTGEIPDGEYGAGIVNIWDTGNCNILEWKEKTILVEFFGKQISGKYYIIKTQNNSVLMFRKKEQ